MAFNFGAALGAAAQSGVNTYLKLGEEQRQEEELAMRRKEAAYAEEQRNQERKLNELTSQTLGMGDTRVTGQDYTGVTGGIDTAEPALKTEAYTPQQKMADFKQRALAAGIPIQKVTAISGAHRAEKYAEREEMALGFSQQVMDDIKANPNDLGAVFNKHFKDQYNEGKLPGLGDGKTAEVVPVATGGQSIVLKDEKGKVTKTIPLNVDTIQAMTQKWAGAMMASSSPASWWKSREEDLKQQQVDIEREFKGKGGVYERIHDKANAAAEARINKPSVQGVNIDMGTDANGKALGKQRVTVVTQMDKAGIPTVKAYDLGGKQITDPKALGQVNSALGGEGAAPVDSRFATMRKAVLENKDMSYADKEKELFEIDRAERASPIFSGQLDKLKPDAAAKKTALPNAATARTFGQKQFDSAVAKQGYQPFGAIDGVDRYIKNGVQITGPELAKQLHLEY